MTTAEADSETALKKPVWVRSRFGCVMITVILILLLLLLALVIYFTSRNFRVQIDVGCGPERKVEGLVEDDGYVFRGLRYAKPPVGNLRWKPSVQTTVTDCMNGTYFAHEFKSECAQKDLDTGQISGSEDCLFINVWTPTTDKNANLPVMVFIHGGYLLVLSGNTPGYSPTIKMAVDANIVHVSFNYRLNAFGFMALESLSKQDFGFSGNYGLHDQIVALQWIQDNIYHFGGNPGHVTIYGHSSGATSVFALLSTKRSEGLFHRAIMIGGSSVYDKTLEDASEDNLKFVENAGCQGKANLDEEYECLMELTVEEILNAVTYHEYPSWLGDGSAFDLPTKGNSLGAIPIVDGSLIRAPPLQIWEEFESIDVPIVIGNMAQEIDWAPTPKDIDSWSWQDYESHVRAKLDTFGEDISNRALELYPPGEKGSTPRLSFTTMASDICCTCPYDELARIADSAFSSRVYRYVATSRPNRPVLDNAQYAFHTWDMFAFFDSMDSLLSPNADDRLFRDHMQHYLTTFARTGEMPEDGWFEWQGSLGNTAIISSTIEFRTRFNKTRCDFWMDNGFFQYAWMN